MRQCESATVGLHQTCVAHTQTSLGADEGDFAGVHAAQLTYIDGVSRGGANARESLGLDSCIST